MHRARLCPRARERWRQGPNTVANLMCVQMDYGYLMCTGLTHEQVCKTEVQLDEPNARTMKGPHLLQAVGCTVDIHGRVKKRPWDSLQILLESRGPVLEPGLRLVVGPGQDCLRTGPVCSRKPVIWSSRLSWCSHVAHLRKPLRPVQDRTKY